MKYESPTPNTKPEGKPYDIRERTLNFADRTLDIISSLPPVPGAEVVRFQLGKSGTSVGANVEEADGSVTKAEKRRSLVISRKEAREARYWLRLIARKWNRHIDVRPDVAEAEELIRILSAIIDKLS